jgi:hypothetical protein
MSIGGTLYTSRQGCQVAPYRIGAGYPVRTRGGLSRRILGDRYQEGEDKIWPVQMRYRHAPPLTCFGFKYFSGKGIKCQVQKADRAEVGS